MTVGLKPYQHITASVHDCGTETIPAHFSIHGHCNVVTHATDAALTLTCLVLLVIAPLWLQDAKY